MKYELDKSSKKFTCPNCNKKRLVRFIKTETKLYLDEIYGRCDRETSCGYFLKPELNIATIGNNYIARKTPNIIKVENSNRINTLHPQKLLQKSLQLYNNNNFYNYLISKFSIEDVKKVFEKYKIGTAKTWLGATVFWQIDQFNQIRAGKIILLDKKTCKRVKEPYPHITWVHSKLKIEDFNLKQCLFGLHLTKPNSIVAIVESEKTSIIMALFMPKYTWVATGCKQNFKAELLDSIKGNNIIAFPDKLEFIDWNKRSNELNKLGYNIICSSLIESKEVCGGYDLADHYIETRLNVKQQQIKYTNAEITVNRLAKINPAIISLIKTFELVDNYFNDIINID